MRSQVEVVVSFEAREASRRAAGRRVLLAGETVFASLQHAIPPGFVIQPPRDALGTLLAHFSKDTPKIAVGIDERAFGIGKARFALAFDGYRNWGLRQRRKGTMVVFGGGEGLATTKLEILAFVDGRIVAVEEKMLPERVSHVFRDALLSLIAELRLRYPGARFVQAAPLSDWMLDEIEFIGDAPLRGLAYRPLVRGTSERARYRTPAAIAAAGVVLYASAIGLGWNRFTAAQAAYDEAVNDPWVRRQGGIDTSYLDLLNTRRRYMDEPRRQTLLAEKAASIVQGIASIREARIVEIRLPAPSIRAERQVEMTVSPDSRKGRREIAADRLPDVLLTLSVPRSQEAALEHARRVMTEVANHTGISLRLIHQGWRDAQGRRLFTVEGFIHD